MGDISELRGLIVIGTFLSVTLLLIGWMPYQFWVAGEQGRTINVPDYFESSSLIRWNSTYVINITSNDYTHMWGKAEFGHNMWFHAWENVFGDYVLWNKHYFLLWGVIQYGTHEMDWISDKGINRGGWLYENEIEEDWDATRDVASYKVQCDHFYMMADFAYNTTAYSSVYEAWDSNDLHILFGIDWDQKGTSYDAWSLISSVLFWKPIAGIPLWIMQLISIPIYIAAAYIAYILILRAIGAVFGGGGA